MNYTFTRADTCLYLDKDGLWKRGAVNYPQATNDNDWLGNYFRASWIPKAIENLILRSEEFNSSPWVTTPSSAATFQGTGLQAVITPNYAEGFDGSMTADRVQLDLNGGTLSTDRSGFNQPITMINGNPYTFGLFIKYLDGNTPATVGVFGIAGITVTETVNLELGNGWYFRRIKGTAVSTSGTFRIQMLGNNGVDTLDCLVWGAMFVAGSVDLTPLDYLTTTTTSVTRQPTDIRNTSFPELASLCGYVDVEITTSANGERIMCWGLNDSNRIVINKRNTNTMALLTNIATPSITLQLESAVITSGRHRIGFFFESGNSKLWLNGVLVGTATFTYTPSGWTNLVLGNNITNFSNSLIDGGFFGQFMASGLSESEWLARCNDWGDYGDLAGFQRTP